MNIELTWSEVYDPSSTRTHWVLFAGNQGVMKAYQRKDGTYEVHTARGLPVGATGVSLEVAKQSAEKWLIGEY